MDAGEVFQVGQWLVFSKGTCFGKKNDHLGIIVGIDKNTNMIGVAVNASSQVDAIRSFAEYNQIDIGKTIVTIDKNDERASCHISTKTSFDCNRPVSILFEDIEKWFSEGLVKLADYNIEVNKQLLVDIKSGIWESPMVEQKYKDMLV